MATSKELCRMGGRGVNNIMPTACYLGFAIRHSIGSQGNRTPPKDGAHFSILDFPEFQMLPAIKPVEGLGPSAEQPKLSIRPADFRACCFANPSHLNPKNVGISQPLARRLFSANCRGFILIAPGYPKCQRHLNTTSLPCPSLFLQGRCSAT